MKTKMLAALAALAMSTSVAFGQGMPSNPTPGSPQDESNYTRGKSDGGGWGANSGAGSGTSGTTVVVPADEPIPTANQCDDGWSPGMPWSRARFEALCDQQ